MMTGITRATAKNCLNTLTGYHNTTIQERRKSSEKTRIIQENRRAHYGGNNS
jgi:hypothetical protein